LMLSKYSMAVWKNSVMILFGCQQWARLNEPTRSSACNIGGC
jgi:hypothetical protein